MTDEIITFNRIVPPSLRRNGQIMEWSAHRRGDNINHCGIGDTEAEAIADLERLDAEREEAERQEAEYTAYASERLGHDRI